MVLKGILASMTPRIIKGACLRCYLRILPASSDREVGNIGFNWRAEDSTSDHKTLIHRHDCRFLGNMLQGVADYGR